MSRPHPLDDLLAGHGFLQVGIETEAGDQALETRAAQDL
jgi:hypothetical protein